jgi:CheY-like chemotaxis protein
MCHLVPQFRRGSLINMRIMPRILIVDDDSVTSLLLSDLLVELGYEVLGPLQSVSAALALLDNCQPDAAIIDVSLGDEDSYPVADRLVRENVPFIFATGFGGEAIPERFEDACVLAKPFGFEAVKTAVAGLLRPS